MVSSPQVRGTLRLGLWPRLTGLESHQRSWKESYVRFLFQKETHNISHLKRFLLLIFILKDLKTHIFEKKNDL